jgi:transposase
VVLDNYATHKHPKVRGWLARHPRVTFHFTPTSCSWANAVEAWFAKLTRQRLKRGVFTSIVELQAAINRFIAEAYRAGAEQRNNHISRRRNLLPGYIRSNMEHNVLLRLGAVAFAGRALRPIPTV